MAGRSASGEPLQLVQKEKREINWVYVTPLFLMALPLIRIAFRKNPVLRDRLFYGGIAVGLVHGTWLISRSAPDQGGQHVEEEKFYTPPSAINQRAAGPKLGADAPQQQLK